MRRQRFFFILKRLFNISLFDQIKVNDDRSRDKLEVRGVAFLNCLETESRSTCHYSLALDFHCFQGSLVKGVGGRLPPLISIVANYFEHKRQIKDLFL